MKQSVSLRRPNRDYQHTIKWTNELNTDLLKVYNLSEPFRNGFMKRLKILWDEQHPEFDISSKHLNEQSKRIIRNNLVYIPDKTKEDQVALDNSDHCADSSSHESRVHSDADNDESLSCNLEDSNDYTTLIASLKPIWDENIRKYYGTDIKERTYKTNVRRKPSQLELNAMDIIAKEHIEMKMSQNNNLIYDDINALVYISAITLQTHLDDLQEQNHANKKPAKPGWIVNMEERITSLQRKISQIIVVKNCVMEKKFTKHQGHLRDKMRKWFGNTKVETLTYRECKLKQELKALSEKLRYKNLQYGRSKMNKQFAIDPKLVFRNSFSGNNIEIKDAPTKGDVEEYWKGIWNARCNFNENAPWIQEVENDYCKDANQKEYIISNTVFEDVLSKLPNNKAPGPDRITGYWYKHLSFYRNHLITLYAKSMNGNIEIPKWLTTATTILLPKHIETQRAKNYRPIACQNIMYKMYTGCLNMFLQDHCETNKIIATEQAGGKKDVWGCIEQLLINKMIQQEVVKHQRNLLVVWMDYQKAFDSISHDWLLKALRLAKVPEKLVIAIEHLMKSWFTKVYLHGKTESIETNTIKYLKGVLQGDSLSVLLFVLALNPLSFLLNKCKGYKIGSTKARSLNISHLFFVDDLKLFGTNMNQIKKQLDIVTQFSKDIGMKFGESKCAYASTRKGVLEVHDENLEMNGLKIKPLGTADRYRYLGQDESIQFDGPMNKERVRQEYYRRVRKVWSSPLSAYNKYIAHNMYAIPVITPTFGLLDWTIKELNEMDIKTRKLLCLTGNFHINGDIDRLYIPRKDGGKGLKSIMTVFETRIISLAQHLGQSKNRNSYLNKVYEHEMADIIRIASQLKETNGIEADMEMKPKTISQHFQKHRNKERIDAYKSKAMHGYLLNASLKIPGIDHEKSQIWNKDRFLTSEFEAYLHAIQEQEISTKYLIRKREVDNGKEPTINNKCRLCKHKTEDIHHIIGSCEKMSSRYYLPLRHDVVAKTIWNSIRGKTIATKKEEFIEKEGDLEYWWNVRIKTGTRVKHNRPDIVIWDHENKSCIIVEVSCPLDLNVMHKIKEKEDIYGPLVRNLQMQYSGYRFRFVPIIVGATGYVPKELTTSVEELGLSRKEAERTVHRMQMNSISGTVKICKTFMKFKTC